MLACLQRLHSHSFVRMIHVCYIFSCCPVEVTVYVYPVVPVWLPSSSKHSTCAGQHNQPRPRHTTINLRNTLYNHSWYRPQHNYRHIAQSSAMRRWSEGPRLHSINTNLLQAASRSVGTMHSVCGSDNLSTTRAAQDTVSGSEIPHPSCINSKHQWPTSSTQKLQHSINNTTQQQWACSLQDTLLCWPGRSPATLHASTCRQTRQEQGLYATGFRVETLGT